MYPRSPCLNTNTVLFMPSSNKNKQLCLPELKQVSAPKSTRVQKRRFIASQRQATRSYTLVKQIPIIEIKNPPITPRQAIDEYEILLTEAEKFEIKTYDEIYYIRSSPGVFVHSQSLKNEFFEFVEDDHIQFRYQQLVELGRGAFGSVIKCLDHKTRQYVAIKLIKDTPKMHKQTFFERSALDKLRKADKNSEYNVIRMIDCFIFRGFVCFVIELLARDVRSAIIASKFKGLPVNQVRTIARDITKALYLTHSLHLAHLDLRPDNIMFTDLANGGAKLIDFGCAVDVSSPVLLYAQSRSYRAPEAILGLPIDAKADIWSLGCVIAEAISGRRLFDGESEGEQLALISGAIGPPPAWMDSAGLFVGAGIPRAAARLSSLRPAEARAFVEACLVWDPSERPSAADLLRHPFVTGRGNSI